MRLGPSVPAVPTAIAAVALVVALTGTAAAAALIITKNSQVAAHVIAGSKAPRRDKDNIVAGSLGATDLHSGAVTRSKLANGSVTSSKLSLPKFSVSVADTDADDASPHHSVLSLDGLKLGLSCFGSGGFVEERLWASSTSPAATLRGITTVGTGGSGSETLAALNPSGTPEELYQTGTGSGSALAEGTVTYQDGTHVISLVLDGVADSNTSRCSIDGTALPASG